MPNVALELTYKPISWSLIEQNHPVSFHGFYPKIPFPSPPFISSSGLMNNGADLHAPTTSSCHSSSSNALLTSNPGRIGGMAETGKTEVAELIILLQGCQRICCRI